MLTVTRARSSSLSAVVTVPAGPSTSWSRPATIRSVVDGLLPDHRWMILSDYGKGALVNHQQLIELARQRGVPVLADPKGTDFSLYRGATLITPNLAELEAVVGRCGSEQELVGKGRALMEELELEGAARDDEPAGVAEDFPEAEAGATVCLQVPDQVDPFHGVNAERLDDRAESFVVQHFGSSVMAVVKPASRAAEGGTRAESPDPSRVTAGRRR